MPNASVVTGHKFLLLFLFLLGILIYYPFAGDSGVGYYVFRLLGFVVIFLSVYAVTFRRGIVFVAVALSIPAIVEHSHILKGHTGVLPLLTATLGLVFNVFIIVVIFRRVFANDKPSAETIFGALCIYLLIGFSFASIYSLIARLEPNAFYLDPATNLRTVLTRFDFVYYSFASVTSLGALGIIPVSDQARSVSIIEAIVGLLYLAVLISWLVAGYRSPPTPNAT